MLPFLLIFAGCAGALERGTKHDLAEVERALAPLDGSAEEGDGSSPISVDLDGSLPTYLAYSFAHSPELRASFEKWRAATFGPARARKLPEPTITYAAFLRSVETRVGPQRHKLGVMQWFPWPTKLTAAGHAEAHRAAAAQRQFEALALHVAAQVARAYWRLWFVERAREVRREQVVVLESLSAQLRVRLEVGMADLGNVAQVDLNISKLKDALAALDQAERAARASLVQVIGAPPGIEAPVLNEYPTATKPAEPDEALRVDAMAHPRVATFASHQAAASEDERAAKASFAPSLGVGVDWIITGPAMDPTLPDSGKDPVVVMGALKIPLWAKAYRAGVEQARARGAMYRAQERAAQNRAAADVERQLAAVADSARQVKLYASTLVPQAEATYESVSVSFEAGRAGVAEILLAERDLLELQLGRIRAQMDHAVAWAELEQVVGRPVRGEEIK